MFYQIPYRKNCGLRFIGNLPANEGDLVWTDGNVIFGHVPRKGSHFIPVHQSSFPVEGFLDFKGFVSQSGIFHYYKDFIADNWIVNNEDNFKHGTEILDGQRVIDAIITDDNDFFVAKEGFFLKNQTRSWRNPLWYSDITFNTKVSDLQDIVNGICPFSVLGQFNYGAGKTLYLGPQDYLGEDKNDDIVITKNDIVFSRFNLKTFADLTVDEALSVRDKIMAQSVKEGFNLINTDTPPDSFIASVFARPLAFNINQNGDWDALIYSSAYGFCFPYFSFDYSMFTGSFPNGEDKVFSENLIDCLNLFERQVFTNRIIPLDFERYPNFIGETKDDEDNYLPEYKQYILDKCAYYVPKARFKHNLWFPALFTASILFKVHNGSIIDILRTFSGGGIYNSYLAYLECNETRIVTRNVCKISVDTKNVRKPIEFPIDDNYYFIMNDARFSAIHNSQGEKILDLSGLLGLDFGQTDEYYISCPPSLTIPSVRIIDPFADYWASQWGTSRSYIQNQNTVSFWEFCDIPLLTYKIFSPESVEPSWSPFYVFPDSLQGHCGWLKFRQLRKPISTAYDFFASDNLFSGFFDWFRLKPCFAVLNGGQFLFGLRGYPLYKIDANGNAELLCYELKNFRLNKLKHKAKALDV